MTNFYGVVLIDRETEKLYRFMEAAPNEREAERRVWRRAFNSLPEDVFDRLFRVDTYLKKLNPMIEFVTPKEFKVKNRNMTPGDVRGLNITLMPDKTYLASWAA